MMICSLVYDQRGERSSEGIEMEKENREEGSSRLTAGFSLSIYVLLRFPSRPSPSIVIQLPIEKVSEIEER